MFRNSSLLVPALVGLALYSCAPDFAALSAGPHSNAASGDSGTADSGASGGGMTDSGGQPNAQAGDDNGGAAGRIVAPPPAGSGGSGGSNAGGASTAGGRGNAGGANTAGGGSSAGANTAGGSSSAGANTAGGAANGGGGNAGQGGTAQDPACDLAGKAFHFDSASYVSAPRPVQDDFTFEAWIKTAASRSGTYFWEGDPIAWADSSLAGSHDFGMSVLNSKLYVNVGEPDVATFSTSVIATNRWLHIAVTRKKSTGLVQIYVNGALEAANTGPSSSLDSVPILSLGTTPANDYFFNGWMDEVRIWQVVRSQSQIVSTLHQVLSGNEPGLVAYYRFDQLVGTKLPDLSGHGNDGVVGGSNIANALSISNAPVCDLAVGGSGGTSGNGGSAGTSGNSGSAGSSGNGGSAGSSGNGGSAGTSGNGGMSGTAGSAGSP